VYVAMLRVSRLGMNDVILSVIIEQVVLNKSSLLVRNYMENTKHYNYL
jgi:hypothetical protein